MDEWEMNGLEKEEAGELAMVLVADKSERLVDPVPDVQGGL
jgi:hypothetical protein